MKKLCMLDHLRVIQRITLKQRVERAILPQPHLTDDSPIFL